MILAEPSGPSVFALASPDTLRPCSVVVAAPRAEVAPIRLEVSGSIVASRTIGNPILRNGCAFRILTGAPIPIGANAVIAQEGVRRDGDRIILSLSLSLWLRPDDNIRRQGEDVGGRQLD